MDHTDLKKQDEEKGETPTSTAMTDTSVPDEEWPQVAGDTGILVGSEAATIARNEALAEDQDDANAKPAAVRNKTLNRHRGRRGPLRRR